MVNEKLVNRERYLSKLRAAKDEKLIKVLTGLRRAGKSTILQMFANELRQSGINEEQIIAINFENPEIVAEAVDYLTLYRSITAKLASDKMNYIFLDEIQRVPEFEKLVDGLFIMSNVDLYITGSNAYFLSGELATLLTGRYIEIKVLPFSFAEYVSAFEDTSRLDILFENFRVYGAMPEVANLLKKDSALISDYLLGVLNTVLFKDVIARKGVNDCEALEHIVRFLFDNIGNATSPKAIADYMSSNYRKIAPQTVDANLTALIDSFVVYPVSRFDIKGKLFLQTQQKYYLSDTGLRTALLGSKKVDSGRVLENIVYLELLRRNNYVWVGKLGDTEVDFVAVDKYTGETAYYQVAETVQGEETLARELRPLKALKNDNFPKRLLTLDFGEKDYSGIQQVNVIDWLLAS